MKHMILSFELKGDVISDHFLMLWFQKDSLDTVRFKNFRTFGGVRGSYIKSWTKVTFEFLNKPRGVQRKYS